MVTPKASEAPTGEPAADAAGKGGGFTTTKAVLVVATVVVDALAPLLQQQLSRTADFESSLMVLAETMSYFLGGLVVAALLEGPATGFRRCVRPTRYLAFLPAGACYSAANFLTYVTVQRISASQFYLLVQLRVVLFAVLTRAWGGVRQPSLAWMSLAQLVLGMVVLVGYQATAAGESAATALANACSPPGCPNGSLAECLNNSIAAPSATSVVEVASAAAEHTELIIGCLGLAGVVLTTAVGTLYLEWQLKSSAQDPLPVQLHHMNSSAALSALLVWLSKRAEASDPQAAVDAAGAAFAAAGANVSLGAAATAALDGSNAPLLVADEPSVAAWYKFGFFLIVVFVLVCRGVFSGSVLKQLDSVAKGLIDVTAICVCTVLQCLTDGAASGTVLGIQSMMLLSIMSYILAKVPAPLVPQAGTAALTEKQSLVDLKESATKPTKDL